MTVEERAAELADKMRVLLVDVDDVDVIAGALVEVLAPLAHERNAVIAGSFIRAGRVQRATVEADCTCYECLDRRPAGDAATDLLW